MADEITPGLEYIPTTAGPRVVEKSVLGDELPSGNIVTDSEPPPVLNFPDRQEVRSLAREPQSDLDWPDTESSIEANKKSLSEQNADEAAKVYELHDKTGEDPAFIQKNLNQFKKLETEPRPDFYNQLNDLPGTKAFLSDPKNMAMTHDDLEATAKPERLVSGRMMSGKFAKYYDFYDRIYNDYIKSGGLTGLKTLVQSPELAFNALMSGANYRLKQEYGPDAQIAAPKFLYDNPVTRAIDEENKKLSTPDAKRKWQEVEDLALSGEFSSAAELTFNKISQEAPNQLANFFMAMNFGPGAAAGWVFSQSAERSLEASREAGQSDTTVATQAATLKGAVEWFSEKFGSLRGLSRITQGVFKKYGQQSAAKLVTDFLRVSAGQGLIEGTEEVISKVGQDLADYFTGNNPKAFDKSFDEYVAEIKETFVGGAVLGFATTAPTATVAGTAKAQELRQAQSDAKFIKELAKSGADTKLAERSPKAHQELMKQAVKNTPVEKVYIDANTLDILLQKEGQDPTKFAADLGLLKEYEAAKEKNGDLVIPTEKYVSKAVQENYHPLLQSDIRLRPDALSINEAKLGEETAKETEQQARRGEVRDKYRREFEAASKAAGIPAQQAGLAGTLLEQRQKARAQRVGEVRAPGAERVVATEEVPGGALEQLTPWDEYPAKEIKPEQIFDQKRLVKSGRFSAYRLGNFFWQKNDDGSVTRVSRNRNGAFTRSNDTMQLSELPAWLAKNDKMGTVAKALGYEVLRQDDVLKSPLGFYSQVEVEVQKINFREMPAHDLLNRINNTQGIKKEELVWTGFKEWLQVRAEEAGASTFRVVSKSGEPIETTSWKTREQATESAKYFEESPANRDLGAKVEEVVGTGKVTKAEVIEFIRNNGVKVEQVVLAENFSKEQVARLLPRSTSELPLTDELSWDEGEIQEPSEDYISEQAHEDLWSNYGMDGPGHHAGLGEAWGEVAQEALLENLDDEELVVSYEKDEDGHPQVEIDWAKKRPPGQPDYGRFRYEERPQGFVGINFGTGDAAKLREERLIEKIVEALNDKFLEDAERSQRDRYYDDTDYADHVYTERETGWELSGRPGDGEWYSSDTNKHYRGSIEEAQVQIIDDMIDKGVVETEEMRDGRVAAEENDGEPVPGVRYTMPIGPQPESDINAATKSAKWASSNYRMPGGSNYREVLLRLPGNEFDESHWDQKGVIAHIRMTDRTDEQGRKILGIEEIQSDYNKKLWEGAKVPAAPFVNSDAWVDLAVKRMIRLAADQGYDAIAWFPSAVHTKRWATDSIAWVKHEHGFRIEDRAAGYIDEKVYPNEQLARIALEDDSPEAKANSKIVDIGSYWSVHVTSRREATKGALDADYRESVETRGTPVKTKEELVKTLDDNTSDLTTNQIDSIWERMQKEESGAKEPRREFYENLYDKKVLKSVEKLVKNADKEAKVAPGNVNVGYDDIPSDAMVLPITPKLRDSIQKGIPLFQADQVTRGFFDRANRILGLIKGKANVSTQVHELSHSWFLEFDDDYKFLKGKDPESLTGDQVQVIEDAEYILNWMGAKSFSEVTTEQQEKFAKAWEGYLATGEAPSVELRSVFERFKIWMTNLGRTLMGLNVEVTPELRDVFARMIATDDQIEFAKQEMSQSFVPGDYGITGDDAEKVSAALSDAEKEAKARLEAEVIKSEKRKQLKSYKEARKKMREEVSLEVQAEPVYLAWYGITKATRPDGSPMPEGSVTAKLDSKEMKAMYKPGLIDRLPRGSMTKNGEHPDFVAAIFGFNSGTELVVQLASAEPMEQVIDRVTDERMKQEHGDLLTDPKLSDEAMKALHNNSRGKLLRLQLEIMAKNNPGAFRQGIRMLGRRVPTSREVRSFAQKAIDEVVISDLKPHLYQRQGARAAKLSGSLFAKGDIAGSFGQKRSEYYSHELFRVATDAKENIEESEEFYQKIFRPDEDLAKTRDMDFVLAARAVLSYFGFGKVGKTPLQHLQPLSVTDQDRYSNMVELVNAAIADAQPLEDITYGKFSQVDNAVRALWSLSKEMKEIEVAGQKQAKEVAIQALLSDIDQLRKPGKTGPDRNQTDSEKQRMSILGVFSGFRRVESWADGMGENFKRYLTRPVHDGKVKYHLKKLEAYERLAAIIKPIEGTLHTETIHSDELNFDFKGRAEVVGMLLHLGNESNKSKLIRGRKWGEVDEEGVIDTSKLDAFLKRSEKEGLITKQDWDTVQGIWDLLEELKPDAQKAHKKMYGYHFNEITATPVQTAFGEYKGGYFPAMADPDARTEANIKQEAAQLEQMNGAFMFPTGGRGQYMSRVDGYAQPLIMNLAVSKAPIEKALRFTYIEPAIKQVGKLIWDKNLRNVLEEVSPGAVEGIIIPWLKKSANQSVSTPVSKPWRGLERFAMKMRRNQGVQLMSVNLANALQQVTGLSLATAKIDRKYLWAAHAKQFMHQSNFTEMIESKSDWMKTRNTSQIFEIEKDIEKMILNQTWLSRANEWTVEKGSFFAQAAQNYVDKVVWWGAYTQYSAEGFSEADSVAKADEAVRLTQGSFQPEDISAAEGGNAFTRLFTQFFSYWNMQANLLFTEGQKALRERSAGTMFWLYVAFMIPAITAELISKMAAGRLDDDDDGEVTDDFMRLFFGAQARTAVSFVPLGGRAATIAAERLFAELDEDARPRLYNPAVQLPALSGAESMARTPAEIVKIFKGEMSSRGIRDIATTLGLLTGSPLPYIISRPFGYMVDVEQGKVEPAGPVDYGRGLLTGQSGNPRR